MKTAQSPALKSKCELSQHSDPRVRRTRQLLENAFRALIKQKPLSAISVQDITEYATINRATFYAHYTDKDDLATSVLRSDLRRLMIKRFHELPPFNAENVVEMGTLFCGFLESLHNACPKTSSELPAAISNTLQEELYHLMEHWLAEGNAHLRCFPNCSKTAVATVLSWSIYGSALQWLRSHKRDSPTQIYQEMVRVLLPLS